MNRTVEQRRPPGIPGYAMDRPRNAEIPVISGVLVAFFFCLILFTAGQAQAQESTETPASPPPENAAEPVASPKPDESTPETSPGRQAAHEPQPSAEETPPADRTQQDPTGPVSAPDGTYSEASPSAASPAPVTEPVSEPTQGPSVYPEPTPEPMPQPEPQPEPEPQPQPEPQPEPNLPGPVSNPPPVDPIPTDPTPAEPVASDPVPAEQVPAEQVPREQVPSDPVPSDNVPEAPAQDPVPVAAPADPDPAIPDPAPNQDPVPQRPAPTDPAPVVSSSAYRTAGRTAADPVPAAPAPPDRVVARRPVAAVSPRETAPDPAPTSVPVSNTPKADTQEAPARQAETPPRAGLQGHRRAALKVKMSAGAEVREDAAAPAGADGKGGIVGRLAGELARTATAILESVPQRVGTLIEEGVERLAGGLQRVAEGLLGGTGAPADGVPPASVPAPPPVPVSTAYSSGSSLLSGESGSCGGAAEKLFHQFAILAPFSAVVPSVDGEITWLSREPLVPSSAPRPPNERPG